MEGSVEAKLGFEPMKAYWNSMHWMWHVCPRKQEHCLVFFPGKIAPSMMMSIMRSLWWIWRFNTDLLKLAGSFEIFIRSVNISQNDAFKVTLALCVWRQYIEDIKNSQKGRPHPDKKASNLDLWWQLLSISKAEATNTYSLQTNCKKCLGLKVCMIRDLSIVIVTSPAWQFKSNPQYRIYKVFKHTARKSASGLPPAPFHCV